MEMVSEVTENLSNPQRDGRVNIMPASVLDSVLGGFVGHFIEFLNWQRI
jgi:hypothetical protein